MRFLSDCPKFAQRYMAEVDTIQDRVSIRIVRLQIRKGIQNDILRTRGSVMACVFAGNRYLGTASIRMSHLSPHKETPNDILHRFWLGVDNVPDKR